FRAEIIRRLNAAVDAQPLATPEPTRRPMELPDYTSAPRRARHRRRRRNTASRGRTALRRFLVKEIASGMAFTGTVWACACSTRATALRCFDRRVVRNFHCGEERATVIAFDR